MTTGSGDRRSDLEAAKARAERGISQYLSEMEKKDEISGEYLKSARQNVYSLLSKWLDDPDIDRLSPNLKRGLTRAIDEERWNDIVNAFARWVQFGTGGIRALMAFDRKSIIALKEQGIDAAIIKGENTINNLVLLRAAFAIGQWLIEHGGGGAKHVPQVVVGCDSRIQGTAFAKMMAECLLSQGLEVYLFDEPVPYPEVTFAVPTLGADVGIFISASHNDYRYNGFKLSGPSGAQISMSERDEIVRRIGKTSFSQIRPVSLENLRERNDKSLGRLRFLGGKRKIASSADRYFGCELVPIHDRYIGQVRKFYMEKEQIADGSPGGDLQVVFAAFNGAGKTTVPNILGALGFKSVYPIHSLFEIDGMFPAFESRDGEERQPDPGDPRAAVTALRELAKEKGEHQGYIAWSEADLLVGTDPDADRCGVVLKPPASLAALITDDHAPRYSREHVLIPADDMWTLLLWYRLHLMPKPENPGERFIAISHTTSDAMTFLAKRHGLGVLKTWVGFAWLSDGVRHAWAGDLPFSVREGRLSPDQEKCHLGLYDTTGMRPECKVNVATMEQSNGFSILGAPPASDREMGVDGHVLDKDGTLAALLTAEVARYAKRQGTDLMSLLVKHIYADDQVGLFVNYYEPDPLDGEYPGLEGSTKKRRILDEADRLYKSLSRGNVVLGGRKVTSAQKYWTGKYDGANGAGFPDEGLRFYFGRETDHLTIRPSGTTNSLRFHVQIYGGVVKDEAGAWRRRLALEAEAKGIVDHVREIIGAPRQEGAKY